MTHVTIQPGPGQLSTAPSIATSPAYPFLHTPLLPDSPTPPGSALFVPALSDMPCLPPTALATPLRLTSPILHGTPRPLPTTRPSLSRPIPSRLSLPDRTLPRPTCPTAQVMPSRCPPTRTDYPTQPWSPQSQRLANPFLHIPPGPTRLPGPGPHAASQPPSDFPSPRSPCPHRLPSPPQTWPPQLSPARPTCPSSPTTRPRPSLHTPIRPDIPGQPVTAQVSPTTHADSAPRRTD